MVGNIRYSSRSDDDTCTYTYGDGTSFTNGTTYGFNNFNIISNADALCQAEMAQMSDELRKMIEAEASRRRDLSYLVPRRPPLRRLRYHVAAPRIRFMPVLRQPRSVHRCHRRTFRCGSLRRRFVCRNAGLVALRAKRA